MLHFVRPRTFLLFSVLAGLNSQSLNGQTISSEPPHTVAHPTELQDSSIQSQRLDGVRLDEAWAYPDEMHQRP